MTAKNAQTFVLVHGAWHGGWCWRRVAELLQEQGHRVVTPTLTGLGERSHLLCRSINLDTHITDIVNVFRWERIENAVLVAHSYAGWVVSGALETVHSQVSAIVYLDAHLPNDGERGIELSNSRSRIERAVRRGDVATRPPTPSYFGVNRKDRTWVKQMMTLQPLGVSLQLIHLTGARERIATKVYIRARGFESASFEKAYRRAKRLGWRTMVLPCGHDVMIDEPGQLAQILADIASHHKTHSDPLT
jgi:pimeloyl-ACP methyl ester carboxylesterase